MMCKNCNKRDATGFFQGIAMCSSCISNLKKSKRRINESSKKKIEQEFDNPLKNKVRDKIISYIGVDIKKILILETEKFLFAKQFPEKKIYVYEHNIETFNKMKRVKPRNVSLFNEDISNFNDLDIDVDFIWLDFCGNYWTEKPVIYALKERLNKSKLFAFTFSKRTAQKIGELDVEGSYELWLTKELQELLDSNIRIVYGETYNINHSTMTTLIFKKVTEK